MDNRGVTTRVTEGGGQYERLPQMPRHLAPPLVQVTGAENPVTLESPNSRLHRPL